MKRRVREAPPSGALLLDTHVLIWLTEANDARISVLVRERASDAQGANQLGVSDITFLEVARKTDKGVLILSLDASLWLRRVEQEPGIRLHAVTREILVTSARLRLHAPADPVDRILIATAMLDDCTLVTADRAILDYARRTRGLRVLDARV